MDGRRIWAFKGLGVSLVGAIAAISISSARADSITTAAGTGADAYVLSSGGTFGSSSDLLVKNDASGPSDQFNRKIYLRFDLSQLTSFGHNAGSSSLTLAYDGNPAQGGLTWNFTDASFTYELFGLKDGTAGDLNSGWTESGITWSTAPANTTTNGTSFNSTLATDLGSATIPLKPSAGATLTFSSAALTLQRYSSF